MTTFGYKQRLFPVGPRISMLFSLCCVLLRQETQAISLEDCCKDGHQRGAQREDCTSLPLISETNGCRIVQEQCCTAKLEDIFCNQGIDMAKDQGACEALLSGSSCETKTARMCCDCCLLGRLLQDQGQKCTSSHLVAHQCKMVSQVCCSNETPEDQKGTTTSDTGGNSGPVSGVNNLAQSDWCRAARCSQHCLGNGTCGCLKGYKLKADGRNCEDINECLLGSHNCLPGERCINTAGHYRCLREMSCGTGYELTESNKCEDINECELGTHNCGPHLDCKNLQGSFRCIPREQCGEGYIQEALGNCIDINECMSLAMPCPPGQMCLNTAGSYECQRNNINCGRGYHLNEEGTRCVDVDECQGPDAPCSGHGCINLVGSFRCECRVGYLYNSITRTCEDNNECRHYPGRLCAHKCENTLGSYKCSCTAGFRLATDGRNCDDVNECDSNPCSQECANVYGSYQCYCRRGYQLSDTDGVNCEDIDECALPTGGHICAYRCHNTPGSFLCSCPSFGYSLAPNGRSCQDINECVAGTHSCSVAESCFNIQGGFRCLSFECPSNYRRAGEASWVDRSDIIRCVKSCQPNDIGCILDPVHSVSHTVISMPTYREFNKPEEIVFLRTMLPAHLGQTMANPDIVFDILEGNTQNYFDIIKRYEDNMAVGVVRQVKPIVGPLNTILKLAMNYVLSGVVSHRNIINVHVFVSEFWF